MRCLFLGIIVAAALARPSFAAETAKPNFVFILIDDMGWKDLGCQGSDFYRTPNIDQIAAQGMRNSVRYA